MSICIIFLFSILSCGDDTVEASFEPDFDFSYVNDNLVRFENKSTGDYFSVTWDFGNGVKEETTVKNQTFNVTYPTAGNYEVSVTLLNFVGKTKTKAKTVNIATTSLSLDFSAELSATDPNIVKLTNLTEGEFDSFKWKFRHKEVENQMNYDAYFPFAGNYDIELIISKDGTPFPLMKSINILTDDADYIDRLALVWSDEFDGSNVNNDDWTFETGASGWGNNELQNYTNGTNADVSNGQLTITARKIDDNQLAGSYSSTRMISKGKKEFQYGRMEIRAKLPSGTGIWPAIWMLGGNIGSVSWPACGEIDILEYVGYQPNIVHATIHTPSGFAGDGNGASTTLETCEEEFHNYGIIWTEKKIDFYIDTPGNTIHTYSPTTKNDDNWPFNQTAFFILNIAVGGTWGGAQGIDNSIFPQTLEIDYVRVFQEP